MSAVHGTDTERGQLPADVKGSTFEKRPRRNYGWVSDGLLRKCYLEASKRNEGSAWICERLNAALAIMKERDNRIVGDELISPHVNDDGEQEQGSLPGIVSGFKSRYGKDSLPALPKGRAERAKLSIEEMEAQADEFDSLFE